MNAGKYIFSQLVSFLPKRVFDGIVKRHVGDKWVKHFTCWNQLLVMMFGQLAGCDSLREVTAIIDAIKSKSYHLGFGSGDIKLSNLSYANANRDYKIFEEFAYHMINLAQSKRITRPFVLNGKFYAFDSTTIDLCMSLFEWAYFRKTKSGTKVHTLFDVVTQIPTYIHITEAKLHDVKAMDEIPYEPNAFYIFDKGYYDLARLYRIQSIGSLTNDFTIKAKDIAMLYKQRWQVELFFRWIKQHLRVLSFWGTSENAVRIQIYVAVITYCLVAIVEHDCQLGRTTFNVIRVLSRVLTDKTSIRDLFKGSETIEDTDDETVQLQFKFMF